MKQAEVHPKTIAAMDKANKDALALGNLIIADCKDSEGRVNGGQAIAALLSACASLIAVTAGVRHLCLPGSTSEFAPHGLAVLAELRKDIELNRAERTIQ